MSWSSNTVIRSRRESLGLSQSYVAEALGVTKSLLSHIESGKRQPTEDQVGQLAKILNIPRDLLILGSGRLPGDVVDLLENHAAEAVAAVRQHKEAHALDYPTLPSRIPIPGPSQHTLFSEVPPERIEVRRTSSASRTHSYHTKVPPDAIVPFIRAFTKPGETVLDPFCGSGMTGVAALMEGRNAVLSDLSPAAVHIARNYTTPCDLKDLEKSLSLVEEAVRPTIEWLYRPANTDETVEYTTWSDIYKCSTCSSEILYWDVVQEAGGKAPDLVTCQNCGDSSRKASLEWVGEKPVQSHTSAKGRKIHSHSPTQAELNLIYLADQAPIPYWIPDVQFGPEREMWRASHRNMGIDNVAAFFSRRNLHALASLRHAIILNAEGRVREALMFAFTAAVNRASRRYQWNAKRPTNVMSGTLYISSLRYEWNVWSLFKRKAAEVVRYYRKFPSEKATADVFQHSAADLECVPDNSVDMVFMDPPFGSNIFYADASLLWESWLGVVTNPASEIVVNKHRSADKGGKSIEDYGSLMQRAFSHAARVLKPGGRAILAFSNSNDRVWQAIQGALQKAGFETESVHLLHKGQPSIKGVKGVTGKERVTTLDLMLCLKHGDDTANRPAPIEAPKHLVDQAIISTFRNDDSSPVLLDEVYSAAVRSVVASNFSVKGITMPKIAERCKELGASEDACGRWSFPSQGKKSTRKFFTGYLSDKEFPVTDSDRLVEHPLSNVRVPGGRSSPYYLAHSYHTKVPPEAIQPFIEHYTEPGDVVLDPFCGSGMTGVAAAQSGRRAILNDLSPAAIHLAWNHTQPCDPEALADTFYDLESRVSEFFRDLYRTPHKDGKYGIISWTLWSTEHQCTECSNVFFLWDAIDRGNGRLGKAVSCPHCHATVLRSGMPALSSKPAWISYIGPDGKRYERSPEPEDISRALSFDRESIEDWYPSTSVSSDREMYVRCALHRQNISTVADFYTARNLKALARLWREIMAVKDERIRRALAFSFTNTAWHGTRMRRFNARGGQRPLTGTLYIPQLSSEVNVLSVMRNKISQLQRYYRAFQPRNIDLPSLKMGSAGALTGIQDSSVDYIFTDPPFGSNIFYADCNIIWESWLNEITDQSQEAVVNRSLTEKNGGKTLSDYERLISESMHEMIRVLKPGAWATVVFHSTDPEVWQAIRNAADIAGFHFHEASSLDRKQQSHKGYKGRSGSEDVAHFDVVFNLRKPVSAESTPEHQLTKLDMTLDELVTQVAQDPEVLSRGLQGVHSEVMRLLASRGDMPFVSYAQIRDVWLRLNPSGKTISELSID